MQPTEFTQESPGTLVLIQRPRSAVDLLELTNESGRPVQIHAFLPNPLPPTINYTAPLVDALARATHAIGRLDAKANDLANPLILIRPLRNHEAIASSRIEGTRANLDTLVVYQEDHALPSENSDVREIANYVRALEYALDQPVECDLSVHLIRELHRILMDGVRGSDLNPGQIRDQQVVIGHAGDRPENASYIPPPPIEVQPMLRDMERYIAEADEITPLIRIALVHYQFEAIHPFNDGNGRIGRLLIAILLKKWGLMSQPCLDLSAYVLRNRERYIQGLKNVSCLGDWTGWIEFLLHGIEQQANDAFRRSDLLLALRQRYIVLLHDVLKPSQIVQLVDQLFMNQTMTAKRLQADLAYSAMTAQRTISKLEEMRIITEATGRKRDRVYVARELISILDTTQG